MPSDNCADPVGEAAPSTVPFEFDPVWYLQQNPDVRNSGIDPQEHFLRLGLTEGRQGGPVQALEFDHMLWRGFDATAAPALERLLNAGPPRERALAGWVLARWYKEHGRLSEAYEAILAFHRHPEGPQILRHPGPYLLGVTLCLACGDHAGAVDLLDAGRERFGALPDFELAQMQIFRARGAENWELTGCLTRLYVPHRLLPVRLITGPGAAFDRLETASAPQPVDDGEGAPLISVIVPVFNRAATLPTALRSLRAQSWRNLEIIIVDDGSTDDSRAIAEAAAAADSRIRILAQDRNMGAYATRNTGFEAATGAFVTVHDADDWSHPQKIERQIAPLLAEPELRASVSHWVRASNDLEMTRWRMEDRWVYRNVSSLMIRSGLRDILGYWDRVRVNADTEYYYRILHCYGGGAIREVCPGVPLAFGRTDPASLTNASPTHLRTQFTGVRRDYMEAAHNWHTRARVPGDLYLPSRPAQRPFRAPLALSIGDPEPAQTAFDILGASEFFDRQWYMLCHSDVLRADLSPVHHYLTDGACENRDPGPRFSSGGYRYAMGLAPDQNPLLHYETEGRQSGAAPLPVFSGALADGSLERPRILFFAHTSGKTLFGAERSMLDVLRLLVRRGFCPVVVLPAMHNPDYLEEIRKSCSAVEMVPQMWRHMRRPPSPETVEIMRGLIRKHRPAEVHVNTIVLDAPLLAARTEGVPTTVYVRELPAEDAALCRNLGGDANEIRAALIEQADRFVATSAPVAEWLACPDRTTIRPNSVDDKLFDLPFVPGPMLNVALISSNVAKKGISDFLAIARMTASKGRHLRFLLIGPPTQDLHLMRPWPPNVEFRNYATNPVEAVQQADIVLSLSKFAESFGRTVMEAMAAGRPVICYDRGAPPTLIDSGVNGLVVAADDREAVMNALLALEVARGELMRMSAAARQKARFLQAKARDPRR